MKLFFTPQTLEFKRPFYIAHGSRDTTPVVFTRIEYDGISGYGEASLPPYLGETQQTVHDFLSAAEKALRKFSNPLEIASILSVVDSITGGNTAAKASVDIALHDLKGKLLNKPCSVLFGGDVKKELVTSYTIPMDHPSGISLRVEEAKEYSFLKLKLGSADDKKIVKEVQKHTNKSIFVDVNEGWTDKHFALDMLYWLSERKCLFAEQPMPKKRIDDTAWLTERSPIPIIADEAIQRFSDLQNIKGVYSGINIKLMKCTGLQEAHKMILQAKKLGLKTMIGCMSESTCGVSAAAQLASLVDWIDLDGPLLIKKDYFQGVKFSEGKIILNDLPGIGVRPLITLPYPVGETAS